MEKLVLIDGNSLINRAFYATPPLTKKDGVPVNGIYGFTIMLLRLLTEEKPDYLAVAFDLHAPTFRHEMYADYKGTRKPMPEDLRPQIPLLKELLAAMEICIVEKEGWEADDVIGTIAKSTDVDTIIVTGDRDALQLVDDHTTVFFTKRGITDVEVYDAAHFKDKTELTPAQIIDLKALMGDSSDNIPGVPGIGEKTAKSLLAAYGTTEGIYARLEEIAPRWREKLREGEESSRLSRVLATIDTHADVTTDLEKMRVKFPFPAAVRKKFAEMEFRTLVKREGVFEDGEEEGPAVRTEAVTALARALEIAKEDTISLCFGEDLSLYTGGGTEYAVKLRRNFFDPGLSAEELPVLLRAVFSAEKKLVLFDKKKWRHLLSDYDVPFLAAADDVLLMKYLADFSGREERAEEVAEEYGFGKEAMGYALSELARILTGKLREEGMEKLYRDVELPLADVLYAMEKSGFYADLAALDALSEKYGGMLKELEGEIYRAAGVKVNLNSPKQLGDLLFGRLGLKSGKKNKKGFSTSAEILEELVDEHPVVPLILRYRQIQKLYSTYIEGFRPLIDKRTGLIHTSFNQTVTSTGRLSSKEPNLQNIPVRDDEGREIRRFFRARDAAHVLVGADYSQIELRLLAHFSGCRPLIDAFNRGEDIHALTASQVFGVPLADVTKEIRRRAKAVNFGIIYGISDFGLARQLKIPVAEARAYIETYFSNYPEVKAFMDSNVREAREKGYVSTLLGRKRYIREINAANYNVRSFGERAAMNMPLQGSSADIIKLAMLGVSRALQEEGLRSELILQVHDELIVDALKEEADRVEAILKREMEGAAALSVPLTVEAERGETWYDAK